MTALAPIVLFVYNRPGYTLQTLESLAENILAPQSALFIYADGPKKNATPEDLENIDKVRSIVKSKKWCNEVEIIESEINLGLTESIIKGVTEVVNKFGKVIVLEDDLLFSKYFLNFLNDGLVVYEQEKNVYSVNAYMFPIKTDEIKSFLSPLGTSTLGWATWKDRWQFFYKNIPLLNKDIIKSNRFIRSRFNFADYNYASMLDSTNSWGIRWYYTVFIRNGLGLFSSKSLVKHIGWGPGATNAPNEFKQMDVFDKKIEVSLQSEIDLKIQSCLLEFFSQPVKKRRSFPQRIMKKLMSFYK